LSIEINGHLGLTLDNNNLWVHKKFIFPLKNCNKLCKYDNKTDNEFKPWILTNNLLVLNEFQLFESIFDNCKSFQVILKCLLEFVINEKGFISTVEY
jgi:hypothetical protein